MLTGQTNDRLLIVGRESRKSKVKQGRVGQGREFSEDRFGLMLTRQTNVRKEVLFQVDF